MIIWVHDATKLSCPVSNWLRSKSKLLFSVAVAYSECDLKVCWWLGSYYRPNWFLGSNPTRNEGYLCNLWTVLFHDCMCVCVCMYVYEGTVRGCMCARKCTKYIWLWASDFIDMWDYSPRHTRTPLSLSSFLSLLPPPSPSLFSPLSYPTPSLSFSVLMVLLVWLVSQSRAEWLLSLCPRGLPMKWDSVHSKSLTRFATRATQQMTRLSSSWLMAYCWRK